MHNDSRRLEIQIDICANASMTGCMITKNKTLFCSTDFVAFHDGLDDYTFCGIIYLWRVRNSEWERESERQVTIKETDTLGIEYYLSGEGSWRYDLASLNNFSNIIRSRWLYFIQLWHADLVQSFVEGHNPPGNF